MKKKNNKSNNKAKLFDCQGILIKENEILSPKNKEVKPIQDKVSQNIDKIGVNIENFTGYWNTIENKPCLQDINVNIKPNTLVAVIGKIDSGKTSFLMFFLRELAITKGKFECNGKIAYVEQEPYVFEGTLKDNILFGNMLDESFYDHVLEITSLKDDLDALPKRDDTLIGEKGVTLSGGQRARVGLARAIYSQSDIYLLDDPLSAVDAKVAKVAKKIFNKAIKECLIKDKIVILVTHHVHFAKEAGHIILFKDSKIESQGKYPEMIQKKLDFMAIFPKENESYDKNERNHMSETWNTNIELSEKPKISLKEIESQMFELEDKDHTFVTKQTYIKCIKNAGGFWVFSMLIILFTIQQIFTIIYNRYLAYWANSHEDFYHDSYSDISSINNADYFYLKTLGFILISSVLLNIIKIYSLNRMIITSASNFHKQLIFRIIHTKIRFFDTNPIGRITNRFSGDI